jgi:hypothetical protein
MVTYMRVGVDLKKGNRILKGGGVGFWDLI